MGHNYVAMSRGLFDLAAVHPMGYDVPVVEGLEEDPDSSDGSMNVEDVVSGGVADVMNSSEVASTGGNGGGGSGDR